MSPPMRYFSRDYRPEKNVGDYLLSITNPDLKKTRYPLLELPAINRERCRAEFIKTERELEKKRKFYIDMRKEMNEKWKAIEKEGLELRQNFVQFNEFLLVNMAKRDRAREHLVDTIKFKEKTEANLAKLTEQTTRLKQLREDLERELKKHKIFEHYMGKVVENFGSEIEVKNETNVVQLYEYYLQLSQQLAKQSENIFIQLQHAKTNMSKFAEYCDQRLMGLRTQTVALQGRFEESARKSRRLEFWVGQIKDKMLQITNDLALVKSATWNLFKLICKRKGISPKVSQEDVEGQLIFIKHALGQIHSVNELLRQKCVKKKK